MSATSSAGIVAISGTDATYTVSFAIAASAPGTYNIPGNGLGVGNNATLSKGTAQWTASAANGSGIIMINTLTSACITGTVQLTLMPSGGGATCTQSVTAGSFAFAF